MASDTADGIKQWSINHREAIQPVKIFFDAVINRIDAALRAVPPLVMPILLVLIAWQAGGRRVALDVGIRLCIIGFLSPEAGSLWMTTLAIVLASVILCVAIGLPPGILAGKNDRFEAARAFGASPGQILRRVELPLATPIILAGLNQTIMLSLSMVVIAAGGLGPVSQAEQLFVLSGNNVRRHATATVLSMLRRERVSGTAIGAICSGAHVLARAGFLNGIEAAVHWAYHDLLVEELPDVRLVTNVFVARERIITASGGTAATDLMLHLTGKQHGRDLAVEVADQMVYTAVREGSATQRLSLWSRHGMRSDHLVRAIARMEQCIEDPLPPRLIAEEVGTSIALAHGEEVQPIVCVPFEFVTPASMADDIGRN